MNENIIIFWTFTAIVVILLVGFLVLFTWLTKKGIENTKEGALKSLGMLFIRSNFYIIIATILIIYVFLILALFDKLTDKTLPVLTSIIGFVLGSFSKSIFDTSDKEKKSETPNK